MSLKKDMEEELTRIEEAKEESPSPLAMIEASYDAAKRRISKNVLGSLAFIAAFMIIGFANISLNWLQQKEIITPESMVFILVGLVGYAAFALFSRATQFIDLKLQDRAIELDKREQVVLDKQVQTTLMKLEKEREITQRKVSFDREQSRADLKLQQDLEIRRPFYERATDGMMAFFARDDIIEALKVPATFAEAIERMDDALLKRTNMDVTVRDLKKGLIELTELYKGLLKTVRQNTTFMDQILQQEAEQQVKIKEIDISMIAVRKEIKSLTDSMDTLVEIMTPNFTGDKPPPPSTDTKSVAQGIEELTSQDEGLPPPPT